MGESSWNLSENSGSKPRKIVMAQVEANPGVSPLAARFEPQKFIFDSPGHAVDSFLKSYGVDGVFVLEDDNNGGLRVYEVNASEDTLGSPMISWTPTRNPSGTYVHEGSDNNDLFNVTNLSPRSLWNKIPGFSASDLGDSSEAVLSNFNQLWIVDQVSKTIRCRPDAEMSGTLGDEIVHFSAAGSFME